MAEGGCFCGEVRYRITTDLVDVGYCHCRMCQRASGAPVVAWVTIPSAAFAWTRGRPRAYRSSEQAGRLFCAECGSQLVFKSVTEPDKLDVTVVTLDDPSAAPTYHTWVESRLPWFETADDLPRHRQGREE